MPAEPVQGKVSIQSVMSFEHVWTSINRQLALIVEQLHERTRKLRFPNGWRVTSGIGA